MLAARVNDLPDLVDQWSSSDASLSERLDEGMRLLLEIQAGTSLLAEAMRMQRVGEDLRSRTERLITDLMVIEQRLTQELVRLQLTSQPE